MKSNVYGTVTSEFEGKSVAFLNVEYTLVVRAPFVEADPVSGELWYRGAVANTNYTIATAILVHWSVPIGACPFLYAACGP